ncbi:ergothioneine biosynthesis protein EgtB [Dyadobacter sediminis]|uniref:Ergothioneine biosynthesis protein EgtB n=1 Tax=Dyadobacter sediminis TaxID=1493691 RepID=A0A5R9KJ01_9BACT|nr:ergothioneine biosynthesis protein EgtB [Dyadobacter sediminis]TLU96162.1 ergothioneine biosynthesis protein EgtB [Dyadobacter sediminis]GGB79807.1 ergothioneine biosynthesis protein EgtB [Dyadobacter sediminis]
MNINNISAAYNTVRKHSESICEPLETEDYVPQPVPFVSPPKWHLAHSTWFFETFILKNFKPGYEVFDKDFSFLFNSYYNNVGERTLRTDRGNVTRPTTANVYAYRQHVDRCMNELLENLADTHALSMIQLGLHHEQQHQELLVTDIKYILGHNPLFPVYKAGHNLVNSENTESGFLAVHEGVYNIGFEGEGFCFDNELGRHKVYLHEFEISKSLVTNGEYIAFMEDGGYQNFNLWLDEGWSWVNEHAVEAPMYWHKINGEWHYYTLAGLQKVNPDAMLSHISFYEAAAFAQWKEMRLPSEAEWEIASDRLDWGQRWEWTNSSYLPYPGFTKAKGAVGEYNGKFMINQMVLRGASVATSPEHSRKTYRNFFHAHERWQYTGIRLAR